MPHQDFVPDLVATRVHNGWILRVEEGWTVCEEEDDEAQSHRKVLWEISDLLGLHFSRKGKHWRIELFEEED